MANNTTNGENDAETVDATSLGKASNSISKATLIMIAGTVIFIIIAVIIFSRFFSAPTGVTGTGSTNTASTTGR